MLFDKAKEHERQITQITNRCIHFTGIINECCDKNISYDSVRQTHEDRTDLPLYQRKVLPCFLDKTEILYQGECLLSEFPTREEAEDKIKKRELHIIKYFGDIENNICPNCKIPITKKQQGSCVYAVECGCRLYQGKLNG